MRRSNATSGVAVIETGSQFDALAAVASKHFAGVAETGQKLFAVTPAGGVKLSELYLDGFTTPEAVQHHNCNCCKTFLKRYGHLATITDDGKLRSVFWGMRISAIPVEYRASVASLKLAVERGTVRSVWHTSDAQWGTAVSYYDTREVWHHFAMTPPREMLYAGRALSAGETRSLSIQHFYSLTRVMGEHTRDTFARAVVLLESDSLTRSETQLGGARFLLGLKDALEATNNAATQANLVWKAVADAPAGWCTPRNGMLGNLLDGIRDGKSTMELQSFFATAMAPLAYRRPQAAPSAGNLVAASALVSRMGLESAFARRYARLSELQTVWAAPPPARAPNVPTRGVFAGIIPHAGAASLARAPISRAAPTTLTWSRFARTVLPNALSIEAEITSGAMPFGAFSTAVDSEAPPLFQWDNETMRNPVSWYTYPKGSNASYWCMRAHTMARVLAISPFPMLWNAPDNAFAHLVPRVLCVLEGCRDRRSPGLALFPEILRSELHPARASIEAASNAGAMLEDASGQLACGLIVGNEASRGVVLRVTTTAGTVRYNIDRCD